MKLILFIGFILTSFSINGQTISGYKVTVTDTVFQPRLIGSAYRDKGAFVGKQYMNTVWREGDILLSTGEMVLKKYLKINGLLDELIWLNQINSSQVKIDKKIISEFWLKDSNGLVTHYKRINPSLGKLGDIFAEIMHEGELSLYIYRQIVVKGTETVRQEQGIFSMDKLEPAPIYLIKFPSGKFFSMDKPTRHSLLRLFPEQRKTIRKILKTNSQPLGDEQNLIKAVILLNRELYQK